MNSSVQKIIPVSLTYLRNQWIQLVLILLAGLAVYSNTFHVPFVLDDNYSIEYFGKSGLVELLLHGTPRRVADLTFALNYKIHGTQLPGYHVTNLIIHLGAACTLYFLAKAAIESLCGSGMATESSMLLKFMPIASAMLFVLHPIQTQAVTYTIQRYTSLASLLYLISVMSFIRSRCMLIEGRHRKTWFWACVSFVSALLAFGSKQNAATLPIMLIAVEYLLFDGRLLKRNFFIASGLLILLVPMYLMYRWDSGSLDDFLYDLQHATSDNLYMARTTYFLTQARVVLTYMRLLFFPVGQSLYYDYPVYSSLFSWPVMASLVFHGTVVITAVILLRKSKRNTPASSDREQNICLRLFAFGVAWYYITLAVESSFIPIRDVIFEHRLYLPSVGFFIAVTSVTVTVIGKKLVAERVAWVLLVLCGLLLGSLTFARNQIWGDSLTLWQDTAEKAPRSGIVLVGLANEYLKRNQPEKALPLFVRGNELDMNLNFRTKLGIGLSLKALNVNGARFTTGEEYLLPGGTLNAGAFDYKNSVRWNGVFHNNLGLAYEYLKEPEKALKAYKTAVILDPGYDLAWYNLTLLASHRGNTALATEAVKRLKLLNPPLAKEVEPSVLR